MSIGISFLLLFGGILFLSYGAKVLVDGASNLALLLGIKPIVIAATIIALGTSLPEVCVSVLAAWHGASGIAVGNIVGSNIANIALIFGICLLFLDINIKSENIIKELVAVYAASLLFALFCFDKVLQPYESVILLVALALFLFYYLKLAFREDKQFKKQLDIEDIQKEGNYARDLLLIVLGLVFLVIGGEVVTKTGVHIATYFGISDSIIGTSIIAVGTSLPELSVSLMAVLKGKPQISLGTIIGSNILNILVIGGIVGFSNVTISNDILYLSIPVMLLVTFIFAPLAFKHVHIGKKTGIFFLLGYATFLYFLYRY
ncbi:MAG: calcium/sodium antiporter [Deltaproteobacteria bacterium]|nr:calcium/sodium antiporter [Deltaproteobacteria bacterium]